MLSRRKMLLGLFAAPAVVAAGSLMPISARGLNKDKWLWAVDPASDDSTAYLLWKYDHNLQAWHQVDHTFYRIWADETAELPPMEDCSALVNPTLTVTELCRKGMNDAGLHPADRERMRTRQELHEHAQNTRDPMTLTTEIIDAMKQQKVGPYAPTDFTNLWMGEFPDADGIVKRLKAAGV